MAELIYHIAMTLDGFIADTDGKADDSIFLYEGAHVTDFMTEIQQYDAVLMGGKTYEYGFQFGLKPGEPGYKGLKHYVFSSTMQFESTAEVELIRSNAADFIGNLKRRTEGKLWLCGGGQLAGALLEQRLIDQLVLKVNPVMIGAGIPLFGSFKPRLSLELAGMKEYANGVVKSAYNIKYS